MSSPNPQRDAIASVVRKSRLDERSFRLPGGIKPNKLRFVVGEKPAHIVSVSRPANAKVKGDGGLVLVIGFAETSGRRSLDFDTSQLTHVVLESEPDARNKVTVYDLTPERGPEVTRRVCRWRLDINLANSQWYRPV